MPETHLTGRGAGPKMADGMAQPAGKCPLCGGAQSVLLQVGARHAPAAQVRRCGACDLVFLHPQPRPEELASYYGADYREEYEEPPVAERYRRDLPEAYARVQRLRPHLTPDTRLLEVGSGSGAFLYAVRPYVREAVGVEPDVAARTWIERTLGMEVLENIPPGASAGEAFHLVVSFHVLEHVPHPVDFLTGLGAALRSGGELIIEVPNVDDALVGIYRVPPYLQFYYQKAHLTYFSPGTLALALDRAGYQASIRGIQRYDLSNHLRWMLTGQPGGQGFYHDLLGPAVQAAYADALIGAGRADTLWAVARRKHEALNVLAGGNKRHA